MTWRHDRFNTRAVLTTATLDPHPALYAVAGLALGVALPIAPRVGLCVLAFIAGAALVEYASVTAGAYRRERQRYNEWKRNAR